ncbi:tetratricopeptide repeat protein [Gracilibacillus xinjiangensis]|uniref:Tetratricopeptide repeat protein n=1 Tax=Gracilibacillus xinjiangensis TaxID=1193282 RepID=A0ABV8WS79_9BACI
MGKKVDISKQLAEGRKVLMKGVAGDKNAVKKAYDIFSKLRDTEPNNAVVEAYYGSALTLRGRDAVKTIEKADLAQEGLNALNKAVSKDSNNKEIRLLRANVCLRLPESFFKCSQTAIKDYTFLLDQYKKDPKYLSKNQIKEVVKDLSTAYKNAGKEAKAKEVMQQLKQL